MPDRPDDRPKTGSDQELRPEIFAVVNGKKFPRPGLETVFTEPANQGAEQSEDRRTIAGAYCSCNKVCTCVPVASARTPGCSCVGYRACGCVGHRGCGCVGHRQCSCVGHTTCSCESHTVVTGCRCAPVH